MFTFIKPCACVMVLIICIIGQEINMQLYMGIMQTGQGFGSINTFHRAIETFLY